MIKRVPIVAMEPNAIPGFTHRHLSRHIARALVSFPETARWFRPGKTELTGMPVRPEFFNVPPRTQTPEFTILITGGSQGSRTLNRAAQESWSLWKQAMGRPVRLLHQTGRLMFAELAPRFAQAGVAGEIHEFLNDMPSAYEAADIVVSRAGMGAVSELAAAGKPSILVPFPGAADQHQHKNAEMMQKAGASILVEDSEMTGRRLVEEVARLANDPVAMERMSVAARSMAHPDAARTAANILEEFV